MCGAELVYSIAHGWRYGSVFYIAGSLRVLVSWRVDNCTFVLHHCGGLWVDHSDAQRWSHRRSQACSSQMMSFAISYPLLWPSMERSLTCSLKMVTSTCYWGTQDFWTGGHWHVHPRWQHWKPASWGDWGAQEDPCSLQALASQVHAYLPVVPRAWRWEKESKT